LRVAYTGAEPVRAEMLDRFSDAFAECGFQRQALFPTYGLAEATLIVSGGPAHDLPMIVSVDTSDLEKQRRVTNTSANAADARRLVGCGSHSQGELSRQHVIIVNPESCKQCEPDEIGEIWVAGPHVAMGYWNRPEETCSTFKAHLADTQEGPFLRTGDLGFIREGDVIVTGRLKDLIILHGRNVYPQDIEWTMEQSHPALAQAGGAAFSVEINNQEQLIVVQELAYRKKPDLNEVLESIRQAIAETHELPVYQVLLIKPGTIPKTSSGKIQRQATRAKFLTEELQVMSSWRIESETQELVIEASMTDQDNDKTVLSSHQHDSITEEIRHWLVAHLAKELRIPPTEIDVSEPFTYYGLASVEGVAMVGKLEEWLDRSIPLSLVWDYPTVEAVADFLGTSDSNQAA
ncbi:MAG: AMP-binding protein, partial [Gammaproteobacteria bacterium]